MPRKTVGRRAEDIEREVAMRGNRTWRRVAVGALIAWAFIATIGFVSLAIQAHDDTVALERATRAVDRANQASSQAVQASQLTIALGQERHAALLANCESQNQRHDATIRELDRLLGAYRKHASRARRVAIAQSRGSTVLLINALAPKQNCGRVR